MPVKRTVPVWRIGPGGPEHVVVEEAVVEIALGGRVLVRASCLPEALEDFAVGFLASEGLIAGPQAIASINVSADLRRVDVRADVDPDLLVLFRERMAMSSGCGQGASGAAEGLNPVASDAQFRPEDILDRMKDLEQASALFRETGGVHAAALTDGKTLTAFAEDLGRHNAVDKVIGRSLRAGAALAGQALLSTGRVSADVMAKAVRVGIPVVASHGAATSRAIELALAADIAVVGFARGRKMNVYTSPWRLGLAER
jgi:FdhD protein